MTIETAALKYSAYEQSEIALYCKQGFIDGAKSLEAKEYHIKNMYTEEEVKALVTKFWDEVTCDHCGDSNCTPKELNEWFDTNKKK